MLSCILFIMLLVIFGKLGIFALKATWGITKLLFTVVFLPLMIVGFIVSGLFTLAIPLLIIAGVAALACSVA